MAEQPQTPWRPTRRHVSRFLTAAGREVDDVTDEVYKRYAPLVAAAGKPGYPRHRLALHHLRAIPDDQAPDIDAFLADWEQRSAARRALREAVDALVDRDLEAAQAYVRQVRADTGAGPTWAELGAHLGWPENLRQRTVRQLQRRGALTFTTTPRSLDVPDTAAAEQQPPSQ